MNICGKCKQSFEDEAAYIAHVCAKSGVTPADPHHQNENPAIAEAALERGAERIQQAS